MAKDGTMRRGTGQRTSPGKKPLAEKIRDGQASRSLDIELDSDRKSTFKVVIPGYMKTQQFEDSPDLLAEKAANEVWNWLKQNNLEWKINPQLVNFYAMSVARWIQCEEMISKNGLLGKHPTTGNETTSPFVSMSREYMRQIQATWYNINRFVQDNAENAPIGKNPNEDMMERLLLSQGVS